MSMASHVLVVSLLRFMDVEIRGVGQQLLRMNDGMHMGLCGRVSVSVPFR